MRYVNSDELSCFHDAFLAMCEKHAITKGQQAWGFPSGVICCDTYSFNTEQRVMYIGIAYSQFQSNLSTCYSQ